MLQDGFVCRAKEKGGITLVIPDNPDLRKMLLKEHHDVPLAGHLGVYRMMGSLSARYYWRGM